MKIKTALSVGCLLTGGFLSDGVSAAQLDLRVAYRADSTNPGNTEFINITPPGGYCVLHPQHCLPNTVSFAIPLLMMNRKVNGNATDKRLWIYQSLDSGFKDIEMTSTTGTKTMFRFRLTLLSQQFSRLGADVISFGSVTPSGGCNAAGNITTSGPVDNWNAMWAWGYPEGVTTCWMQPEMSSAPSSPNMTGENISIGYELIASNPLRIGSGDYTGTVRYSVGNGAQIDLGEGMYSDSELVINVSATVHHDLAVSHIANGGRVKLQPPGGWGRWMQGGAGPQRLENDSTFYLTASGEFKINLQCEYTSQINPYNCGLRNTDDGRIAELHTYLTIPEAQSSNGATAEKLLLRRYNSTAVFPKRTLVKQRSTVNFLLADDFGNLEQMLSSPGSQWRGSVTLVFDAE